MRSKNPFSDEPEEQEEGSAGETRAGETRVSETRADESPSDDDGGDADTAGNGGNGGNGGDQERKQELPSAPSIGPHTVIDKRPPEERLDFDKISDTDAMGKSKRREVVGKTYGPTKARVFGTFAAFIAIVAALTVGFYFLAQELDAPPADDPAVAPWSEAGADQKAPKPLQ